MKVTKILNTSVNNKKQLHTKCLIVYFRDNFKTFSFEYRLYLKGKAQSIALS